ncbi:EAL domain-containing protein [Henriciella sp. AS95]|uniref:EAL domain-containing protein n=1 Tax=Henriciella sp. AS95 TaxID=3135782 RepID=UPI00316E891D
MTIKACRNCQNGSDVDFEITMAFQPIVDVSERTAFAYEALVRGIAGQAASEVLARLTVDTRYAFDQLCRTTAIRLAAELGLPARPATPMLSINFMPNAVYEPRACIRQTLTAALQTGFPIDRILFEFTEDERHDTAHLLNILRTYRSMGFATAIDDFGAGYSGLNLLSDFQPDFIKLDMALIRGIDQSRTKQAIVKSVLNMALDLGVEPICEGIETQGEYETLADMGVRLMQGFFLAPPAVRAFPECSWPQASLGAAANG